MAREDGGHELPPLEGWHCRWLRNLGRARKGCVEFGLPFSVKLDRPRCSHEKLSTMSFCRWNSMRYLQLERWPPSLRESISLRKSCGDVFYGGAIAH